MEVIKFDRVVSVSNEIQGHSAQNILDGEISPSKNWMCEKGTDKAVVILQMERAAVLTSVHVGNAHSAFVEVLVGRAADTSDEFQSLIPMSTFMNPHESKTSTNPNRTRFFNKEDFNVSAASKSWDRIKVVCSQPFNKHVPFGLCFFIIHGEREAKKVEVPIPTKEEGEEIQVGSFFKKKRSSGGATQLTVGELMREEEKDSSLVKHTPLSIGNLSSKLGEKLKTKKEEKVEEKKTPEVKKRKLEETSSGEGKREKPEGSEKRKKKEEKEKVKKEEKKKKKDEEDKMKKKGEEEKIKKREEKKKKRKKKPFEKLLEDVVLVISGFKNPLRANIRSMALEMGSRYSGDWEPHCTHLVCAFDNTPKFHQVKGKGKIVKKEWVEKCHADRRRYPWRRFALDKSDLKKPESEEEIDCGEESEEEEEEAKEPEATTSKGEKYGGGPSGSLKTPSGKKRRPEDEGGSGSDGSKTPKKEKKDEEKKEGDRIRVFGSEDYDAPTDEDEEEKERVDTTDCPMPYLPDIFSKSLFYVDPNLKNRSILERYIVAYGGNVLDIFTSDVKFYVTNKGGSVLNFLRKKAPDMVVVKPSWIGEVNEAQRWVEVTPHLLSSEENLG